MLRNTESGALHLVDITRAFTQTECLIAVDRYVLSGPPFILLSSTLEWNGALLIDKEGNIAEIETPAVKMYEMAILGVLSSGF